MTSVRDVSTCWLEDGGSNEQISYIQRTRDPKNTGRRKLKQSMRKATEQKQSYEATINASKYARFDNSVRREACQVAKDRNLNARQLKGYIASKYGRQLSLSTAQSWLRNSAYFFAVSSDAFTKKSIRGAHHPELEQVLH